MVADGTAWGPIAFPRFVGELQRCLGGLACLQRRGTDREQTRRLEYRAVLFGGEVPKREEFVAVYEHTTS